LDYSVVSDSSWIMAENGMQRINLLFILGTVFLSDLLQTRNDSGVVQSREFLFAMMTGHS